LPWPQPAKAAARGVVAVPGAEVIRQGRGAAKGIAVKAGHRAGAVRERADPKKGEALVVVLGLVMPAIASARWHSLRQFRVCCKSVTEEACRGRGLII
jgi:hypothetical protein